MSEASLQLRVLMPTRTALETVARKVAASGAHGAFCLLPHHVDFVAVLAVGLLAYVDTDGEEVFAAVDGGTLVKCGADVLISTPNALVGAELGELEPGLAQLDRARDERDSALQLALRRLEVDLLHQLIEMDDAGWS